MKWNCSNENRSVGTPVEFRSVKIVFVATQGQLQTQLSNQLKKKQLSFIEHASLMLKYCHWREKTQHTVCKQSMERFVFHFLPCKGNSGQSRKTGHFENLRSCNSPAAVQAPVCGQKRSSSWPLHTQHSPPGYLDVGCLPAPQTVIWRGCDWGEVAAASSCSSVERKVKNDD